MPRHQKPLDEQTQKKTYAMKESSSQETTRLPQRAEAPRPASYAGQCRAAPPAPRATAAPAARAQPAYRPHMTNELATIIALSKLRAEGAVGVCCLGVGGACCTHDECCAGAGCRCCSDEVVVTEHRTRL